jgi:formylglycine-generating enzyme required for sulfatase activity
LRKYIAEGVSAYEANLYQRVVSSDAKADYPYMASLPFDIEDANLFFGREAATQSLYQAIQKDRLTVLSAKSGAGKTSLLKAGLLPRLIRARMFPVYVGVRSDLANPSLALKRRIAGHHDSWPQKLSELSLHRFLWVVCSSLRHPTQELIVILDHFENFLIWHPKPSLRSAFIEDLADCYEDHLLPVRFVISLDKAYLGDLSEFQGSIPNILHNVYRVSSMNRKEMVEAIAGPLSQISRCVSLEPSLLDALLRDLGQGEVELTHLQIICDRLFGTLPRDATRITSDLYQSIGEAEGILSGYLDGFLVMLRADKRLIARGILKELVSSEATNRTLDITTMRNRLQIDQDLLDDVLGRLVDARLLRRVDESGIPEYELAGAYLVGEVMQWVGQDELENKRAQDLLQGELAGWRLRKSSIDDEGLDVLRNHVKYLDLDDESNALLLYSALHQAHDVGFWWGQIKKKEEAMRQIPFERMIEHLAENFPVCKRLARHLKSGSDEVLLQPLLSAFRSAFRSADGRARRDAARVLWTFASRLSLQEIVTLAGILWPFWLVQALPFALGLVLLVLIVPQAWFRVVRVHAVPGKWLPIAGGDFVIGTDREEAEYASSLCLEGEALDLDRCPDSEDLLVWSGRLTGAWLPDFSIMENEVTNAQYRQCLNDGYCSMPEDWDYKQDDANKPATGLDWSEAAAYCQWLGGRLPTEGEWEKAARGRNGNYFPWGNEWDPVKANLEHYGKGSVRSVNEYAASDASPYDILNMAGNVREWTASVGFPHPEGKSFTNVVLTLEEVDENKPIVLRGGSWQNERSSGMASRRGLDSIHSRRATTGFRCVCPADAICESPWTWWWVWFGEY